MLSCAVIVLVGLALWVVLMPMFARTGGHASRDTCQSNLKLCAIAFQSYCADYNGMLPSSVLVSHSPKWNSKDFEVFSSVAGAVNPVPPRKRTWPQLVHGYAKHKDIFFCPKDPTRRTVAARGSYWYKLAVDKAWYGDGCSKPCRRDVDFAFNADQMVLYERAGLHDRAYEGLRNGVRINVAFLDTHVKSVSLVNSLPANGDRWVTSPLGPGEPAYFNFDNKRPKDAGNPPPEDTAASYVDPGRYCDLLP